MTKDETKAATWVLVSCAAAGALLFLALPGCGGEAKSTSDEADAAYSRIAKSARELTFRIERASEDPPDGSRQIAREFRSFAGSVDFKASFLQVVSDIGPVGLKAFLLQHSLLIYESTLRAVVKHARRGDRSLTWLLRGVRQAGAEVRASGASLERALRAAAAG